MFMPEKRIIHFLLLLGALALFSGPLGIAQEGADKLKAMPESERKADTLLKLAKTRWYEDPDQCILLARRAYQISLTGNYRQKQADALNIIGAAHFFKEELDSAIHYFNISLELCYALGYREGVARVTNNLGLMHDHLGNYDQAIEYYYQSLEIEREANNNVGIASSYLNIGSIYVYLKDFDKALEYMTNSLRLFQEAKNEDGILRCFTNIGSIYADIGIPDNALNYSKKALDLSREMKNPDLEAANLNNIGEIYFKLKNYRESISYYNQALEIEKEFDDSWSMANTLRNIGSVYFAQGKYESARARFLEALEMATEIETKLLQKDLYHDLYLLNEAETNYKEALHYHVLHTAMKDSIFGEDRRAEIVRLETMGKIKYKDQQMEIIRHENQVKNLTIKAQRYGLYVSVALVLLVISVLIILRYRSALNRKAKTILEETNRTISRQKEMLEDSLGRLRESEEKYKALSESVQDGLVIIQDRKLIYANEVMSHLLGYETREEILLLKPNEIIAEQDLDFVRDNYEKRIAGKDVPTNYDIRLIRSSGKLSEVKILVKLITLQGKPAIIGTIKDISGAIAYERNLIRAKEKAEKATFSKSLFLAGMSHEIRNHLNGIIGIADVLGYTKLDQEQKEYVNVIRTSGDNLTQIINDILDLSRIEAGQVVLESKEFSLRQVIQDVLSLYDLKASEKGIELIAETDPGIPEALVGDPVRLSQVLTNLVSNAIKFTDRGSVRVKASVLFTDQDETEVKFHVTDTGTGIPVADRDKLFKPFSQGPAGASKASGGSGLGLVICKHLVRLMKGEIGVESSPQEGADFWFRVNFGTAKQAVRRNGKHVSRAKGVSRILLVEDNVLNQHLTTNILGKEGYTADIAANGKEGLDLFKKNFYNVILMDIQMPVMDGIEATTQIRKYESENYRQRSTIIAITAHAKEGDEQKLKDAGLDHFLSKPFKPEALLDIIKRVNN